MPRRLWASLSLCRQQTKMRHPTPSPSKRKADLADETPEVKKAKLDESIVNIESIKDPMLLNIKANHAKADVFVRIYCGNRVAIMNQGDTPVTLKRGMTLLGFGKVTYGKEGADENTTTGIAIKFNSSFEEVMFNNVLMSLGAIVEEQQISNRDYQHGG
jgi:hypothetical protein